MAATTGFFTNRKARVLVNTLNQAPDPTNIARTGDIWMQVDPGAGPPGTAVMWVCTQASAIGPTSIWTAVP